MIPERPSLSPSLSPLYYGLVFFGEFHRREPHVPFAPPGRFAACLTPDMSSFASMDVEGGTASALANGTGFDMHFNTMSIAVSGPTSSLAMVASTEDVSPRA